jgi:hypothetical protein
VALYGGLNHGELDVARLRRSLAGLALPRAAGGRLVLAVDVSPWLRPSAPTSSQRRFCHTYGRGKGQAQRSWAAYSVVAALETGRSSCSARTSTAAAPVGRVGRGERARRWWIVR